jgi:hypothetical protein
MKPDNRPYYVACHKRFCYVRGLPAAYAKLAEYIDGTVKEVRLRRKHHNCPGMILRVNKHEARAAGI